MFLPSIPELLSRLLIIFICFPIHELAHAYVATQLGDDTPRRLGRVTLNPLAHIDPFGAILLLLVGFGWAKPVPVNPYNLRNGPRLGMVLVAAAGPFSNFILAALAAIPFRLGLFDVLPDAGVAETVAFILAQFVFINLALMLFNLIPIPPLDGSKILRGLAPYEWDNILQQLERFGPILLMLFLYLGGQIGLTNILIGRPANALFLALTGLG